MSMQTLSREEFDRRLEQSTRQLRQRRVALEAREADLADLIERYSSVLERLEAVHVHDSESTDSRKSALRRTLNELAERTSAIASAL